MRKRPPIRLCCMRGHPTTLPAATGTPLNPRVHTRRYRGGKHRHHLQAATNLRGCANSRCGKLRPCTWYIEDELRLVFHSQSPLVAGCLLQLSDKVVTALPMAAVAYTNPRSRRTSPPLGPRTSPRQRGRLPIPPPRTMSMLTRPAGFEISP